MVLDNVYLSLYFHDLTNGNYLLKQISLKEVIERQLQRNLKDIIGLYNKEHLKFIRAEITTNNYLFNYKLYNYKTLKDLQNNLILYLVIEGFENREFDIRKIKQFTFGIKDLINKNEILFNLFRNQNGFFVLGSIDVLPLK